MLQSNLSKSSSILTFVMIVSLIVTCFSTSIAKADNEFTCIMWGKAPEADLFFEDGKDFSSLEFVPKRRSEVYKVKGTKTFALYNQEEGEDGKSEWKLVGKTSWPEGAKRMLFIIVKIPDSNGLPLSIMGVNDSEAAFPPGSFQFANFTNTPFKVKFGDISEILKPKDIKLFKVKMRATGGVTSLNIKNKKGATVFGRRMLVQARSRELVFISPSAKGGVQTMIVPQIIQEK